MSRLVPAAVAALLLAAPAVAADPPSVPELVRRLESGTPTERVIAAELLGDRGPAAADAVPALAKAMKAVELPDPIQPRPADRGGVLLLLAARDALARIGPK